MTRDEFEKFPVWVKNAAIAVIAQRHYGPTIPDGPVSLPSSEVAIAATIIFQTYLLLSDPLNAAGDGCTIPERKVKAFLN